MRRFPLALGSAIAAGALVTACTGAGRGPSPSPPRSPNPSAQPTAQPSGPLPVVWIGGTVESVGDERLTVRQPDGGPVSLVRLQSGATRFLRREGSGWAELPTEEVGGIAGDDACAEALLDGAQLVALRVFLGVACGPGGTAP